MGLLSLARQAPFFPLPLLFRFGRNTYITINNPQAKKTIDEIKVFSSPNIGIMRAAVYLPNSLLLIAILDILHADKKLVLPACLVAPIHILHLRYHHFVNDLYYPISRSDITLRYANTCHMYFGPLDGNERVYCG